MSFGSFQLGYGSSSPLGGSSSLGRSFSLDDFGTGILNFGPERVPESRIEFNKIWDSWRAFERFLEEEEDTLSIELRKVQTLSGNWRYTERRRYVCSRAGTGGQKVYKKKHPEWGRKVDTKLTECKCSLVVKTYHDVETVLGRYRPDHNHPTGLDNIKYMLISRKTRNWIAAMVRGKVDSGHVVSRCALSLSNSSNIL